MRHCLPAKVCVFPHSSKMPSKKVVIRVLLDHNQVLCFHRVSQYFFEKWFTKYMWMARVYENVVSVWWSFKLLEFDGLGCHTWWFRFNTTKDLSRLLKNLSHELNIYIDNVLADKRFINLNTISRLVRLKVNTKKATYNLLFVWSIGFSG